ncbi:DUF1735 and LamG domain-containing protein [Prevotella sp. S7 MS 2]|uniref:DUF1735 and LamG domain-containing protein n=1 Tax=Prevotella sp. S7 MS 2 TaxID=1287488 RepID=UPI000512F40F|nr:DUF1735 and LamG domain-containing protein [Prevotella sp. S7 MS 2]KGI59643.1 hypothetical protein HMPREF0671_10460 [Prevotella sp. S7 MS 2]
MKKISIKNLSLVLLMALATVACKEERSTYDGVYIVGTEDKSVTATLTVDDVPSAIGINVASSAVVDNDVQIQMEVRNDLVALFNKEHHKNYEVLPEKAYSITNEKLTIEQGKHITTKALKLSITDREPMKIGTTYVVPISIKSVEGTGMPVIEASRTIYVVVNQVIITKAADLTQGWGRAFYVVDFGKEGKYPTHAMKALTYEARVRFRKMTPNNSKWCFSIMGLEENLCFRTSGNGKDGWKLQTGDPIHFDSRDAVPNDKWIHVALVYDAVANKRLMYLNGELQGEAPAGQSFIDMTNHYAQSGFYIGNSANDNRTMEGYISEARVWATARSAAELKNNVCWVDPTTEGLLAYWRFDGVSEKDGMVVTDLTGNGYDAHYKGWDEPSFVDAVRCPE